MGLIWLPKISTCFLQSAEEIVIDVHFMQTETVELIKFELGGRSKVKFNNLGNLGVQRGFKPTSGPILPLFRANLSKGS